MPLNSLLCVPDIAHTTLQFGFRRINSHRSNRLPLSSSTLHLAPTTWWWWSAVHNRGYVHQSRDKNCCQGNITWETGSPGQHSRENTPNWMKYIARSRQDLIIVWVYCIHLGAWIPYKSGLFSTSSVATVAGWLILSLSFFHFLFSFSVSLLLLFSCFRVGFYPMTTAWNFKIGFYPIAET